MNPISQTTIPTEDIETALRVLGWVIEQASDAGHEAHELVQATGLTYAFLNSIRYHSQT